LSTDAPEIREHLARYLTGELSLAAFQEWFVPATWELDLADDQLRALYGGIELALAEYTNGDWTEDELRLLLRPLLVADGYNLHRARKPPREVVAFFNQPAYGVIDLVDARTA